MEQNDVLDFITEGATHARKFGIPGISPQGNYFKRRPASKMKGGSRKRRATTTGSHISAPSRSAGKRYTKKENDGARTYMKQAGGNKDRAVQLYREAQRRKSAPPAIKKNEPTFATARSNRENPQKKQQTTASARGHKKLQKNKSAARVANAKKQMSQDKAAADKVNAADKKKNLKIKRQEQGRATVAQANRAADISNTKSSRQEWAKKKATAHERLGRRYSGIKGFFRGIKHRKAETQHLKNVAGKGADIDKARKAYHDTKDAKHSKELKLASKIASKKESIQNFVNTLLTEAEK